jgi:hypothetical protein
MLLLPLLYLSFEVVAELPCLEEDMPAVPAADPVVPLPLLAFQLPFPELPLVELILGADDELLVPAVEELVFPEVVPMLLDDVAAMLSDVFCALPVVVVLRAAEVLLLLFAEFQFPEFILSPIALAISLIFFDLAAFLKSFKI